MADYKQLEERLVRTFMSAWQRRGCSILQVGLHSYLSPDFFWDAGFDVCATDENLQALNYALDSSGPRVEYRLAKADHLPFDDDSFDYAFFTCYASPHYGEMKAALRDCADNTPKFGQSRYENLTENEKNGASEQSNADKIKEHAKNLDKNIANSALYAKEELEHSENIGRNPLQGISSLPSFLENTSFNALFDNTTGEANIFSETCRVAQKGVIVICKNSLSVRSIPVLGNKINPWSLWRKAKKAFPQGEVKIMTSFALPRFIKKRFHLVDVYSHVFPCGDFVGICINFNAPVVTGLGVLSKAVTKKELVEEAVVNRVNTRNR